MAKEHRIKAIDMPLSPKEVVAKIRGLADAKAEQYLVDIVFDKFMHTGITIGMEIAVEVIKGTDIHASLSSSIFAGKEDESLND